MLELAPTISARDASIAFGIAAEKMQLLSGEATMIVGKEDSVKHASFNELIDGLPQANATVVTGESGTDERIDPCSCVDGEISSLEPAIGNQQKEAKIDETSSEISEKNAKISRKLTETQTNSSLQGGGGGRKPGVGRLSERIHLEAAREQRKKKRVAKAKL